MGQMSAGNGVKVKFICLREVRSPTYRAGKVAFSLVVSHVVWPRLHAPAYVYFSCRGSQEGKRNTHALSEGHET